MYQYETPEKRRRRWFNRLRFIVFAVITMILTGLIQQPTAINPTVLIILLIVFAALTFNEVRLMYNDLMQTAVRRRLIEQQAQQQTAKPSRSPSKSQRKTSARQRNKPNR